MKRICKLKVSIRKSKGWKDYELPVWGKTLKAVNGGILSCVFFSIKEHQFCGISDITTEDVVCEIMKRSFFKMRRMGFEKNPRFPQKPTCKFTRLANHLVEGKDRVGDYVKMLDLKEYVNPKIRLEFTPIECDFREIFNKEVMNRV